MAQKIAVYSIPDLKNTTDDALPNYLNSRKFKQSHRLTDVRLGLGYSAVLIAAVNFAADYRFGWDATKVGTFWAVCVYFALNGALTFWIWGVEKGVVYTGDYNGSALLIVSSVTKHTPIYNVTVTCQAPNGKEERKQIASRFARWFDRDGFFTPKPFQQWLASEIPVIGLADPSNADVMWPINAERERELETTYSAAPTPRKRGRPRKE